MNNTLHTPIQRPRESLDCSDAISVMQRHPSTVTKGDNRPMTTTTSDLGSSGCAVAPADRDNREKRDKSSIVTRAASKALDKTHSPAALGKQAGDALKEEGVLQPDFGSPSLPASTPEDLLRPASNASLIAGLALLAERVSISRAVVLHKEAVAQDAWPGSEPVHSRAARPLGTAGTVARLARKA